MKSPPFKQASRELALLSQRSPKEGMRLSINLPHRMHGRIMPEECLLIAGVLTDHMLEDNNMVVSNIASLCKISHKTLEYALRGWREFNLFAAEHGSYQGLLMIQ